MDAQRSCNSANNLLDARLGNRLFQADENVLEVGLARNQQFGQFALRPIDGRQESVCDFVSRSLPFEHQLIEDSLGSLAEAADLERGIVPLVRKLLLCAKKFGVD